MIKNYGESFETSVTEMLTTLVGKVGEMDGRLDGIDNRLDGIGERLESIEDEQEEIKIILRREIKSSDEKFEDDKKRITKLEVSQMVG